MKVSIQAGKTSESINVFISDSSSTTGAGLTGLAYNSGSLTAYYSFTGANATATAITLATLAAVNSSWATGGFKEISSTNMPGWYRLDLPNAVIASSSGRVVSLLLKGATSMAPCPVEIELTAWDNQTAAIDSNVTKFGGTAGTFASGVPAVNTTQVGGTSQTGRDLGASVLLSSGTGTGQVSLSSGAVTLTSSERNSVATALLDLTDGVESGVTLRNAMRYIAAICSGIVSGAGTTTETFKSVGGSTTRVVVTADSSGNRSAVTLS